MPSWRRVLSRPRSILQGTAQMTDRDLSDIPMAKLSAALDRYIARLKINPSDEFVRLKGNLVSEEISLRVCIRDIRADIAKMEEIHG